MSNEKALASDIMKFTHDPLGFVMYAFPWGVAGSPLEKYPGPDTWQVEILHDLGEKLLKNKMTAQDVLRYAVGSGNGSGKAQPKNLQIYTPLGYRRFGDIKVGDFVFGRDGYPTEVIAVHDRKMLPTYRVSFDDGSSTIVCGDHLWTVRGKKERRKDMVGGASMQWINKTTLELLSDLRKKNGNGGSYRQWEIPRHDACIVQEKEVPLHPYLLGLWLGDGCKGCITTEDEEIINHCRVLNKSIGLGSNQKTNAKTVRLHGIQIPLRQLGLFDKLSYDKFVPELYKHNSVSVRLDVLRGLMDTDGTVDKDGSIEFCVTSKQLCDDIMWLVRSLGGKTILRKSIKKSWYYDKARNRVPCHDAYRVNIRMPEDMSCFLLSRKKDRLCNTTQERYLSRWIDGIELVGEDDCMCITVANNDGLYLTNDFIVTHNSTLAAWLILWAMATFEDTRGVVTANTENQLRTKTWAELAKWHRMSIVSHWFIHTATAIYSADPAHEKTWRIDCIPWSENKPEAFAGLHNQGRRVILLFDEASAVPDIIWETAEGAMTDEGTEIIWAVFGNPTRNSGRFHKCFNAHRNRWYAKHIDTRTCKYTNKEQIRKWVEDYGEDSDFVRVHVRGVFPKSSSNQFIGNDIVELARGKHLREEEYNFAPVIIGVDPAWCFDEQTEILTNEGFKFFKDLSGKEQVFSKPVESDIAEWMPITQVHKYDFDGYLNYQDGIRGVNFCITDNHKLLAKRAGSKVWKLEEYKDLPNEFYIKRTSSWQGGNGDSISFVSDREQPNGGRMIKEWKFDFTLWAKFLGWFVSEGCVYAIKKTYKGKIYTDNNVIEIAQVNKDKIKVIASLLKEMGLKFSYRGHCFVIQNTTIGNHLLKHCGKYAANKRIPTYIKEATPAIIEAFLDSFSEGDGHKLRGGCYYFSSSKLLCDDIQECLIKLGKAGKISLREKAGTSFEIDGRKVMRQHDTYAVWQNKTKTDAFIKKSNVENVYYKGFVYCVTTPYHTILVRRNGVCMWSGNCGGDSTEIMLRQGLMCKSLASFQRNDNDMEIAGYVAKFEDQYKADAVFIDLGWGQGIYSAGKQMGRQWTLVAFGGKSSDDGLLNKRVEMWDKMKKWLQEGGSIPDDPVLCVDLTGVEYRVGENGANMGKVYLESKEMMRSRGLASPNKGDALALTFAFPVKSKSSRLADRLRNIAQPYDILKGNFEFNAVKWNPFAANLN